MSARGFPKCFSGSRPGTHVGRDTYECTQSNTQRQKYKHKHHCKQTNVCTDRERERARSDQQHNTVIEDDRQGGLRAVAQTHM